MMMGRGVSPKERMSEGQSRGERMTEARGRSNVGEMKGEGRDQSLSRTQGDWKRADRVWTENGRNSLRVDPRTWKKSVSGER